MMEQIVLLPEILPLLGAGLCLVFGRSAQAQRAIMGRGWLRLGLADKVGVVQLRLFLGHVHRRGVLGVLRGAKGALDVAVRCGVAVLADLDAAKRCAAFV